MTAATFKSLTVKRPPMSQYRSVSSSSRIAKGTCKAQCNLATYLAFAVRRILWWLAPFIRWHGCESAGENLLADVNADWSIRTFRKIDYPEVIEIIAAPSVGQ